ncbi:MAG TPA: hypothetical protein VN930_03880, partial [Xanthobacteraceae bacterium]|nr:hypothetical protein [Xanthobacteraceae bacterium]
MNPLERPASDTAAAPSARWRMGWALVATAVMCGLFVWLGRLSVFEALLAIVVIGGAVLWSTRSASRGVLADAAAPAGPPVAEASILFAFVEALPAPALLLDASGTILAANDAAAATFGAVR